MGCSPSDGGGSRRGRAGAHEVFNSSLEAVGAGPCGAICEATVANGIDNDTLSQLLGLLAHDLRNPLSALHSNLGFIGTCLGEENPEVHEAVQDTVASCDGLAAMIDNLEVLSRGLQERELPRLPLLFEPVIAEAVARTQSMAETHGAQLSYTRTVSSVRMLANPDMVGFALRNLIRNSIQHGGTTVPIRVSLRLRGATCEALIEDGGTAISPELREVAFTAAGQVIAKSNAAARYGRGLGLLCAKIAADAAGVSVAAIDPPSGQGHAFVLAGQLA